MPILLELLLVALAALAVGRFVPQPWRGRLFNGIKAYLTVRMVWVLLEWPVQSEAGGSIPAWQLVLEVLRGIDAGTFWTFAALGALVRFAGVLASMLRWQLVLLGQRIELPFRHVFGAFLIGRAIGFFLPSTAGLDAYKLYDAARFSGRTVEVTAGTVLEKVLGVSGIFLTFLVALPFGMSIFGENAWKVASITVPIAVAVIGGLLLMLWYPGIVQWGLEQLPLPGKARLRGVVVRISNAAAAYRDRKGLVLSMLFLSFAVHFTTAAMYYFMALAVGVGERAAFWPLVFGSSIQIFATVIGPTIGGLGVREAAQLLTVGALIGPGAAIVSATLGFWVGELPTLLGFGFWMLRGPDYRPAYARVDGRQIDYAEAARAARQLETDEERRQRESSVRTPAPPYAARARAAAGYGLGGGVLAGILVGLPEALAVAAGGFGGEAQVLWYGPAAYALVFGLLGLAGGLVLAVLPMDRDEIRGWTPSLAMLATAVPVGLAVTLFRLRRDVYMEQMPPLGVLLAVLAGFGLLALLLFLVAPRLLRGPAGRVARPPVALGLLACTLLGGLVASRVVPTSGAQDSGAPAVPAALRERPNLILIMVDTLRADHLSCYGARDVRTPNLCRFAQEGGSIFQGFAHASWTKPSTATLLTSLVPTSHQTMAKPAALPEDIETVAETLQAHGYTTGAFVSNTNMTASFGFAQGFDEYHYLGPDYLFGARESSSKLILYQIARRLWFKAVPGLRFGDFYQAAEVINRHAAGWLERHAASRFFLFLHYMDPHDPYFEHPFDGYGIARASTPHPDPSMAEEMRRLYVEEIEYLDRHVGQLIARLKAQGLWEDTVIALVSDHGEEFGEHGGFWHGLTLYEEQIHVPLLVKWAAGERRAPADARQGVARLIDVAPTLLAVAGAEAPAAMQGRDLAGGVAERPERERIVFAEEDHEGNVLRAVRTKRWKWIEANEGNPRGLPERELFDVAADPGETRNLREERPDAVAIMRGHLRGQQLAAEGGKVGEASEARLSAAERAQLEALGYVQDETDATP